MPNSLTAAGLTTASQNELINNLSQGFMDIYGADITLTPDTPDGQAINLFAQAVLDNLDLQTNIYNMIDPDNAVGVVLDQRVAINGIQRQGATFTITNVTIVLSQLVPLLQGLDQFPLNPYTVQDNAGNEWELLTTQSSLAAGSYVLAFQAANPGQVLTVPNTITSAVTVVLGVTNINNPTSYSTLGLNEESDAALRFRRQQSVGLASQGYFTALRAALLNINGVSSAAINENKSSSYDGNSEDTAYPLGTPPNSIWVIVDGTPTAPTSAAWSSTTTYSYGNLVSFSGSVYMSAQDSNVNNTPSGISSFWKVFDPVAWAIYTKRNSGAGMRGETLYLMPQIDGSLFVINYDTVATQTLWIQFNVQSIDGKTVPAIAAIQVGLVASYIPGVNQEVNTNALIAAVQAIDSNSLVTFMPGQGFSTAVNGSYFSILSPSLAKNKFRFTTLNVIILPIILQAIGGSLSVSGASILSTITVTHGGATVQMTPSGGYASSFTYALTQNQSGGSIDAGTGIYTPGATPGIDIAQVTDGESNTGVCTVTVI